MKKYAQIVNKRVHGIFEYIVLPEFDKSTIMIDITTLVPTPKVGDIYDGTNFITYIIPLEENKQSKIKELIDFVERQKIVMESNYSSISTGSFIDKRNNALAWEQDKTAPTGYVDKLCKDAAGVVDTVKREALLLAILAKVNDVAKLETYEDDTRTAIKACTTQAELDAIVI